MFQTVLGILVNAVVYIVPLALMDTFMVKKYCGVDPQEWIDRRQNWVQTTRPLPLEPPSLLQVFYQVTDTSCHLHWLSLSAVGDFELQYFVDAEMIKVKLIEKLLRYCRCQFNWR